MLNLDNAANTTHTYSEPIKSRLIYLHTGLKHLLKSFAESGPNQTLCKPIIVDGHFEWQPKYLIGSNQQLFETQTVLKTVYGLCPFLFKTAGMKVSQKTEKYIYSRFPACSAEVMSTRHIHWVFKHRNITHTNVTL